MIAALVRVTSRSKAGATNVSEKSAILFLTLSLEEDDPNLLTMDAKLQSSHNKGD